MICFHKSLPSNYNWLPFGCDSIQLDDVSQSQIEITSETEVGLQFNIDAKKGLSLYISDYF